MRKITVVVNEKCRRKAIEEVRRSGVCRSCMIWQALREAGVNVGLVFNFDFSVLGLGDFLLPKAITKITMTDSEDWPSIPLPVTFTVEVPEEAMVQNA